MNKGFMTGLLALLLATPTTLWAIPITYEIGPYDGLDGYSASWLHTAGGSPGASDLDLDNNGSNDTLYMSAGEHGSITAVTGTLGGDWNGSILSNITGTLNGIAITGGSLGGAYYSGAMDPLWYLNLDGGGTFYFEELDNSSINLITADYLLLWGQNTAAYIGNGNGGMSSHCDSGYGCMQTEGLGLDLYGSATSLSEPGTLLLMMFGLASLTVASRRRERAMRQIR